MESPTCEDSTSSGSAGDGSELGRIHGRAEVQYLHLWAMEVEEEREPESRGEAHLMCRP